MHTRTIEVTDDDVNAIRSMAEVNGIKTSEPYAMFLSGPMRAVPGYYDGWFAQLIVALVVRLGAVEDRLAKLEGER